MSLFPHSASHYEFREGPPALERHLALAAGHLRQAAVEPHPGNRAVLVELARRRWERAVQCAGEDE